MPPQEHEAMMAELGIANNGLFCTTLLETESDYGTSTTYNKKRPELSACGPFTDELGLERIHGHA
jgi:hypothetical protein